MTKYITIMVWYLYVQLVGVMLNNIRKKLFKILMSSWSSCCCSCCLMLIIFLRMQRIRFYRYSKFHFIAPRLYITFDRKTNVPFFLKFLLNVWLNKQNDVTSQNEALTFGGFTSWISLFHVLYTMSHQFDFRELIV